MSNSSPISGRFTPRRANHSSFPPSLSTPAAAVTETTQPPHPRDTVPSGAMQVMPPAPAVGAGAATRKHAGVMNAVQRVLVAGMVGCAVGTQARAYAGGPPAWQAGGCEPSDALNASIWRGLAAANNGPTPGQLLIPPLRWDMPVADSQALAAQVGTPMGTAATDLEPEVCGWDATPGALLAPTNADAAMKTFPERKARYIQELLRNHQSSDQTLLLAKSVDSAGTFVPTAGHEKWLNGITDQNHFDDFKLVYILRYINLYPESIGYFKDALLNAPKWFDKKDKRSVFWSENHLISFLSSTWLTIEKLEPASPERDRARNRLVAWLKLKNDVGFFEFFSTVYLPYSLTPLLNLADFAADPEIKALAHAATQRLLHDLMLVTNDSGVIHAAAGRNYARFYNRGFGHNHSQLVNLLVGRGRDVSAQSTGTFLATSSLVPAKSVYDAFFNSGTTDYDLKAHIPEQKAILKDLPKEDRIPFQWSFGGYFHSQYIRDTLWMWEKFDLYDHPQFKSGSLLQYAPTRLTVDIAKRFSSLTEGSLLEDAHVKIYKEPGVVLSSIQNYHPGLQGAQQMPWAASVGDHAVFAVNMRPKKYADLKSYAHAALPNVVQKDNIALMVYNPSVRTQDLSKVVKFDFDVVLYWPKTGDQGAGTLSNVDETEQTGPWIMSRIGDSYVAAYASCGKYDAEMGYIRCQDKTSAWAIVVGTKNSYGDFAGFKKYVQELQIDVKEEKTRKHSFFNPGKTIRATLTPARGEMMEISLSDD